MYHKEQTEEMDMVRLVADTADDLERAVGALLAALGDRVALQRPVRRGRRGDGLIYGTLALAPGATEASPATGGAEDAEDAGGGWTR